MRWLALTAVGLAGGFVVLTRFSWRHPVPAVDARWVWFGIGVTEHPTTPTAQPVEAQ